MNPTLLRTPRTALPKQNAVRLPFNFTPRSYQEEDLFRPMFPHHYPDLRVLSVAPKKRGCLVWHRRAGKDKSLINAMALAAWETTANYLYLLPEQTQAKKIIWRGIDGQGFRFLDHIPEQITKRRYNSELLVELTNGSTIQFGGSDNYDSWMGTNPRGIIFSEYSLQDPMAWNYFRPILVENDGWAVFNYTARGKNHGYDLYQAALRNPGHWFVSYRTIEDTQKPDGSPVVTPAQYDQEIEDGMPEAIARQEFYLDWDAALMGAYYGDLMAKAQAQGRIGFFPHDPSKLVYTAWDIGLDATAVWFAQKHEGGCRLVDYFEESNTKFSDCIREVLRKPYSYASHYGPHDLKNRNPEKETRLNTADEMGLDFVVTDRTSREDGIEATRQFLTQCQFHEELCARGIDALKSYQRVYDDRLQRFRDEPVHDWSSHGSDALRYLALNWQDDVEAEDWFNKPLDVNDVATV